MSVLLPRSRNSNQKRRLSYKCMNDFDNFRKFKALKPCSISQHFAALCSDSVGRSAIPSVLCAIPSVVWRFRQSFPRFRQSFCDSVSRSSDSRSHLQATRRSFPRRSHRLVGLLWDCAEREVRRCLPDACRATADWRRNSDFFEWLHEVWYYHRGSVISTASERWSRCLKS